MSPIEFDCPHCGRPLSPHEDLQGKKVMCAGCRKLVVVPAPRPVPPPPEPAPPVMAQRDREAPVGAGTETVHRAGADKGAKPKASGSVLRAGFLKKETWQLHIYDTYALFISPDASVTIKFPDDVKRHVFPPTFLSGFNVRLVCASGSHSFLLDKTLLTLFRGVVAKVPPPSPTARLATALNVLRSLILLSLAIMAVQEIRGRSVGGLLWLFLGACVLATGALEIALAKHRKSGGAS